MAKEKQSGSASVLVRYAIAPDTLKHLIISRLVPAANSVNPDPDEQQTVSATGQLDTALIDKLFAVFGPDIVRLGEMAMSNKPFYEINCREFLPAPCVWAIHPQHSYEVFEYPIIVDLPQDAADESTAPWWQAPTHPANVDSILSDYLAYGEAVHARVRDIYVDLPRALEAAALSFTTDNPSSAAAHNARPGDELPDLRDLAGILLRLMLIYGPRLTNIRCGALNYDIKPGAFSDTLFESMLLAFLLSAHAAIERFGSLGETAVAEAAINFPFPPSLLAAHGIVGVRCGPAEATGASPLSLLLAEDECLDQDDSPAENYGTIEIVSRQAHRLLTKKLATSTNESDRRQTALLQRFAESGFRRKLATTPEIPELDALNTRFPNFSLVLDHIRRHLALSRISEPPALSFQPLLLHGVPGIGKSRFVYALARALGTHFGEIAMSMVTASFVLSGGDLMWNGGRPGRIHEIMKDSEYANPVIMLDEIDKAGGDHRFDPTGPLLQLLETHSAKRFMDEAFGLPMDASHIIWIATANHLGAIPPALLDRFEPVAIASPTDAEMAAITQSIYADIIEQTAWGMHFEKSLHHSAILVLSALSPRSIRKRLLDAASCAVTSRPNERPARIEPEDLRAARWDKTPRFGFIP